MGNQLTEIAPNTPFLPGFQPLHIVVIGLDCAGKTSLLYRLKLQEFVETIPTKGFNMERIKMAMGSSKTTATAFQVWDVGGQEKLRPLWKSYTRRTDGLVFVVDAAEVERMEEAKVELHRITRLAENQGVPVLLLANKQDLDGAMSASEVNTDKGSVRCSVDRAHTHTTREPQQLSQQSSPFCSMFVVRLNKTSLRQNRLKPGSARFPSPLL